MAAPAPNFIGLWDVNRPQDTESRTLSDDYHRNIAESVRMSFPNVTAEVTSSAGDLNSVSGFAAGGAKALPGVGGQTVVWFYLNTPPPGYDLEAVDDNLRNLTIAPGGATPVGGGTIDGADDPSAMIYTKDVTPVGTVDNADAPHTHSFSATSSFPLQGATQSRDGGGSPHPTVNHSHSVSGTTASNNANHGHGFTGAANSVNVNFNPRRAIGVLGKLSA